MHNHILNIWFIAVKILTGLIQSYTDRHLVHHYLIFIFLALGIPEDATATPPCSEGELAADTWYDRGHDYLSQKFCEPALWFDNFFSDKRSDEERSAGSFVRWRNNFRFAKGDNTMDSQLSANITLPHAEQRLHLLLMREDEDDPLAIPGNVKVNKPATTTNNLTDITNSQTHRTQLGLRYDFNDDRLSHLSLSGGMHAGTPLQPFVKGRYRYTNILSSDYLARFTETVYWKNLEGFSETSRFDLEHRLTPDTLIRWSNSVMFSEITRGAELGSELSLFHQLSTKSALAVNLGAWGYTKPTATLSTVVLSTRYRRNFYRSWLFYEIEPELGWPLDEQGERKSVPAITFRLEVQFERH
ncbi:hypothetical protein CCP3SC1_470002 [Gammaproteobacteria bacterium]